MEFVFLVMEDYTFDEKVWLYFRWVPNDIVELRNEHMQLPSFGDPYQNYQSWWIVFVYAWSGKGIEMIAYDTMGLW